VSLSGMTRELIAEWPVCHLVVKRPMLRVGLPRGSCASPAADISTRRNGPRSPQPIDGHDQLGLVAVVLGLPRIAPPVAHPGAIDSKANKTLEVASVFCDLVAGSGCTSWCRDTTSQNSFPH
jgi:hypothetical protein